MKSSFNLFRVGISAIHGPQFVFQKDITYIYSFESNNKISGHEVSITQSKGPFTDFRALWTLEVIDKNRTRVKFKTTFTLPFILKILAPQSMIDKVGNKFINAFASQLLK